MGKSRFLWLIPYIGKAGYPNGDGVVFPSRNDRQDSFVDNAGQSNDGTDPDAFNPLIDVLNNKNQNYGNNNNNLLGYNQSGNGYGNTAPARPTPYKNNFEMSGLAGNGAGGGFQPYTNNSGLAAGGYANGGMSQQYNGGYGQPPQAAPRGGNMNPYANGPNPLTGGRMGGAPAAGSRQSPLNYNYT